MNDLVSELRDEHFATGNSLLKDAADEIARLRGIIDRGADAIWDTAVVDGVNLPQIMALADRMKHDARGAVKAETERCAKIAEDHGQFCYDEFSKGGSPDLHERCLGARHIAAAIRGNQ